MPLELATIGDDDWDGDDATMVTTWSSRLVIDKWDDFGPINVIDICGLNRVYMSEMYDEFIYKRYK